MMTAKPIQLERLLYRDRQTIRSRDLRGQAVMDAQRRWWHNRAMHVSYGIAIAPRVASVDAGGIVLDRFLAYDYFGRELINYCCDLRVSFPPEIARRMTESRDQNTRLLLLASDRQIDPCTDVNPQDLPAHCAPPCTSPCFCWVDPCSFTPKSGVPIVALKLENDRPAIDLDFALFRSQRLGRPRVAAGVAIAASTVWRLVNGQAPIELAPAERAEHAVRAPKIMRVQSLREYQTEIDISRYGLHEPCCFASLHDPRPLEQDASVEIVAAGIASHTNASILFSVRVVESLAIGDRADQSPPPQLFPAMALAKNLSISWTAIVPLRPRGLGCQENHGTD